MTSLEQQEFNISQKLIELLESRDFDSISELMLEARPPEIADALSQLELEDCSIVLSMLDHEAAALVFPLLPQETQLRLLTEFPSEYVWEIINEMYPDDRTALLGAAPAELLPRILSFLSPAERSNAQRLLDYPSDSVGRLVTPNYVTVRSNWTPEHVLRYIRRYGEEAESFDSLYVIDDEGVLVDEVSLRHVLLADPDATVASLVGGHPVHLLATDDREEAVHMFERYDQPVLPVLDENGRMLGIVTFDDIADVAKVETTEDFHKVAAIQPLEAGYRSTGILKLFSTRIRWLLILIGVNLLSSGIISAYETTLQTMIALAFFLPLLIDSGGNTGSQAATLMVRALATKDVELRHWLKVFFKEGGLGITLGLAMGLASFCLGYIRAGLEVGMIVGISMFLIVVISNLIGTLLPFALTKLRIDPAVASSPLITTLADATGLLIYFSIATSMLGPA